MMNYAKKYNKKYTQKPLFDFKEELHLIKCSNNDSEFAHFYITHYPKSKGIIGRQFNYKIYYGNKFIGIIGANSPPGNQYGYKKFNEYFNITIKEYDSFLNNNVYRIIDSEKNRGTKILKLFREQIFKEYYHKFKIFLLGLVTFVEPPRMGIVYKADNWQYLGMTQGYSMYGSEIKGKRNFQVGISMKTPILDENNKKYIFGYKFPERYKNRILNKEGRRWHRR